MSVAQVVPPPAPVLPLPSDLATVAARFPWAKPQVRDALSRLPRRIQERIAERGKPRYIIYCVNAPMCGYPLAFLYRHDPPLFLHPIEVSHRSHCLDVTTWCPACDTARTYTER